MELVFVQRYSENTATSASFIVAILMLCQPAVLSRVSTRYVLNCDRNSALPITAIPIECTAVLDLTAQHNLSAKSAISISSCIYCSCACVRVFYVTHAVKSYRNLCQNHLENITYVAPNTSAKLIFVQPDSSNITVVSSTGYSLVGATPMMDITVSVIVARHRLSHISVRRVPFDIYAPQSSKQAYGVNGFTSHPARCSNSLCVSEISLNGTGTILQCG